MDTEKITGPIFDDTPITDGDGAYHWAGLQFANEETDLQQYFFDLYGVQLKAKTLEMDENDKDEVLWDRYENGDLTVLCDWNPPTPDGYVMIAKWHSEDGPVALYLPNDIPRLSALQSFYGPCNE